MLNRIIIMGRLGDDPKVRYTQGGDACSILLPGGGPGF